MPIEFDALRQGVLEAVEAVYRDDRDLVEVVDGTQSAAGTERALVAYLFRGLHTHLLPRAWAAGHPEARIDMEYSRSGWQTKALVAEVFDGDDFVKLWHRERPIVPDLILHERGYDGANLLVVEVKPLASARRRAATGRAMTADWAKVALLTGSVDRICLPVHATKLDQLTFHPAADSHVRLSLPWPMAQYDFGVWIGFERDHVDLRWWHKDVDHDPDGVPERIDV